MLSKKPALLFNAYNALYIASGSSTSSGVSTRPRKRCQYATIAGDHEDAHQNTHEQREEGAREGHVWPEAPKGRSCPTPYQILDMKHNGVYSKTRFHELVKMYHPDLSNGHGIAGDITHHVKLERYRLIIAAHTILSDPVKRNAYDRFGAGWDGRAEHAGGGARSGPYQPGPFSHSWTNPSDPIWQNATWEDWERFYARRAEEQGTASRPPGAPVYMKHSYFLALVIFLAIMGSSANYGRAQEAGTYLVEHRDIIHDQAAKELRKVRQDMATIKGKEDRIQWFMRQREATMGQMSQTDIEALQEERADRLLSDREVCRSEDVSGKE
jgi:hypothetical protein